MTKEHATENENHKVGKEVEDIDLKSTPSLPKKRRKKHRPKVVKEGKPKTTPNPKTPKVGESKPVKRKYVRKKGVQRSENSDPTWKPVAKRALNFDGELEATETKHNAVESSSDSEFPASHGTSSIQNSTQDQRESQQILEDSRNITVSESGRRKKRPYYVIDETKVFKGNDDLLETISVLFPHLKKRRTEKGQSTTTSSTKKGRKDGEKQIHQNSSICASLPEDVQSSGTKVGEQLGNLQSSPLMLKFGPTGRRTKTTHRHRSVDSLNAIMESTQFPSTPPKIESSKGGKRRNDVYIRESQSNMVLALVNQAKIITKKRTKKVTCKVDTSSSPNAIKLDDIPSLDQLVLKFYSISINRESTPAMMQKHKSIVPFVRNSAAIMQESNAIVPFGGLQGFNSKALVPFEPPKKGKPKPRGKVDLDEETERVWNLLMGKESDDGVEGTDVDKEKWWEEERRVFRGRTDSFIARMNTIQGDRRFTKWKGSVVDSVIGVFLTQNVSDHLSSSAFMSLASRFPLQSTSNQTTCYEEGTEVIVEEPDEPEECHENLSAEPVCDQGSITFQEIEPVETLLQLRNCTMQQESSSFPEYHRENSNVEETTYLMASQTLIQNKRVESNLSVHIHSSEKSFNETTVTADVKTPKAKEEFDWDSLRRDACLKGAQSKRTANTMDTLDYEAVRCAEVNEIAEAIKGRGQQNRLGKRIKDFLNRVVKDHGSIDLEWLRDVAPDKGKDYLLSIQGLGLKSVECVRLLTLHQLAFPVDTNIGRIAVRLGWVPLEPLPEEVQLHLLEQYPMQDSIQKYLWPRLCKLDQPTLYELHYQMITFGKVFCTKYKPNCNACPMRAECRHFASAFASARLPLPAPPEKGIVPSNVPLWPQSKACVYTEGPQLSLQEPDFTSDVPLGTLSQTNQCHHQNLCVGASFSTNTYEHSDPPLASTSGTIQYEPIVEVPASPEPEPDEATMSDIEDAFLNGDPDEIPTIHLDMEEFSFNLHKVVQENNMQVHLDAVSTALVVASNNLSVPVTKLKNVGRLRTEHQVYVLPDNHILLKGRDSRETDDPSPYMLAIWTPGEIANSTQPGEQSCALQETGTLCDRATCWSCNNARERKSEIVRGTLLIPCRTAMKGSFPLNGTYFQVNEVFADDESSRNPIEVQRSFLWYLPKRIVYFGTSVTSIFKGLTTEAIQSAFCSGFVCVRGFDHKARAPRPLYARLHLAASRKGKKAGKIPEE